MEARTQNIFTANLHKSNHHVGMWKYFPAHSTLNVSPGQTRILINLNLKDFTLLNVAKEMFQYHFRSPFLRIFQGCPHVSRIKNTNHVPTMLIGQLAPLCFLKKPGRSFAKLRNASSPFVLASPTSMMKLIVLQPISRPFTFHFEAFSDKLFLRHIFL